MAASFGKTTDRYLYPRRARRSSVEPMSEPTIRPADSTELPTETGAMDRVYADARVTATRYPGSLLPHQNFADRLTAEAHWRDICQQLAASRSVSQQFLD